MSKTSTAARAANAANGLAGNLKAAALTSAATLLSSDTHLNAKAFALVDVKLKPAAKIKAMISTVIAYAKGRADFLAKLDAELPGVMLQTVYHAKKHGDVSLADMLIKGFLPYEPQLVQEMLFWFRKHTPISWDAKQVASLDKAKKWDVAGAEGTPYHQEPEVKTRREESKRAITPFSPIIAFNRVKGLLSMLENAQKDGGRGLAEGVDVADFQNRIQQVISYAQGVFNVPIISDAKPANANATPTSEKLETSPPASRLIVKRRPGRPAKVQAEGTAA